jgi:hypothetical protein
VCYSYWPPCWREDNGNLRTEGIRTGASRHENGSHRIPLDQDQKLHGTLPVERAPRMWNRLVAVRRAQLSRFHILGVKKRSTSMELLKRQLVFPIVEKHYTNQC